MHYLLGCRGEGEGEGLRGGGRVRRWVPEPLFAFRFLVKLCSPETTPAWLQAELNRDRSIVERVAYNDTLSAIRVVLAYSKSIFIRSAKYLNMCDVM